ncbi:MAG: hypothetical protein EZS28_015342 [Streblomastix strix]|uniref:PH domain-containing protein n=1 Tax=Streblomastix strix TaxID=222440 RepID=A0A5J4W3Q1_9EUKA|nr:MAG: hypothetical protein EZS28_015342 [Streblomastix strix]
MTCVAEYDFQARCDYELSFSKGDIIELIEKHQSGMWRGELNGKIGLFPFSFVKELRPQEDDEDFLVFRPCEGWLTKQGHFRQTWKKRWFSLRPDGLYYYKQADSPKEQGVISLRGCQIKYAMGRGKQNCFHITYPDQPGAKEFYISAEDVASLNRWVSALVDASLIASNR